MSFRVAPWKTYDPSLEARSDSLVGNNIQIANMAEDVDMDAPQISTLREDDTPEPPPTPARTSKFRVKLLVNEAKRAGSLASTSSQKQGQADSDEDDEDEEEDQLIDDDDEAPQPVVIAPPPIAPSTTRGTGTKRGRGRGGGRKRGGRAGAPGVHPPAPAQDPGVSMTWFEVAQPELAPSMAMGMHGEAVAGPPQPPARKKPGPPKGTPRAIRKKPAKAPKPIAPGLREEIESISEAPPTAASSPLPVHDDHSPEPDVHIPAGVAIPLIDDANLEGVPLPIYPLPSKPFPVQPPPKIGTGFAPVIPLDRSGKPVRRWRQVNREIRGIAGGRWFAKTWVGEKESEFATATTSASSAAVQAANAIAEREFGSSSLSGLGKIAFLNPKGSTSSARPPPIKPKATRVESTNSVPLSRATSVGSETPLSVQMQKKRSTLSDTLNSEILPAPVQ
ncbi:hypothetical protein OBBRIDRAFT_888860 [Obba rivulosa]|uniref:Uncharacterized protein n=1 Tax=Obba rivulosa TaxID=1052685 RepID=A0A8E2DHZ2_9APHY|nr:hypothetical protein OBBRIDRAFT_888860 [Obba rivulosa]